MGNSKRWITLIVCLALLCTRASGGETGGGEGGPRGYVALTFDDGPTGELTGRLLDGLKARYVSATFFLCGYRIKDWPDLVCRMEDEGHEVAIHGQTHIYLHNQPAEVIRQELETTGDMLEELTGTRPGLFRPPGGLTGRTLLEEAEREELAVILWSIDPEDWNTQNSEAVVRRVVSRARDGDIILMHDLSQSSVRAALRIVDLLEAGGFQFCTVSELAALRGELPEPAQIYHHFPPRIEDSFFPQHVIVYNQ